MEAKLIGLYSQEYAETHYICKCSECGEDVYTREDILDHCQNCGSKEIEYMEHYHFDDCIDRLIFDDCVNIANSILDSNTNYLVKVEGTSQRWNGSREVDQIIEQTKLEDIISKYIEPDRLEIEVYEDRVELANIHHDGTNRYTFKPFELNDLTIKELKSLFDSYDIDEFNEFKKDGDYSKPFSSALKSDLIDYVDMRDLHL